MVKKRRQASLRRTARFIKFKILRINDTPHRIALGAAIGLFAAWSPFLGLHILMVIGLIILLRANKFIALTTVWLCNPLTFIPIYYPSYLLGRAILAPFGRQAQFTPEKMMELFKGSFFSGGIITNFRSPEFWHKLGVLFTQVGYELIIGGFIIGSLVAALTYFTLYRLIDRHRKKRSANISGSIN